MSYLDDYLNTLDDQTKQKHAQRKADLDELEQRLKEPHREAIRNIHKSNHLRTQINKACNEGRPPLEVLDLALQAIAAMTGDTRFYDANMKQMREAHK